MPEPPAPTITTSKRRRGRDVLIAAILYTLQRICAA
jgi:hypothetical protein